MRRTEVFDEAQAIFPDVKSSLDETLIGTIPNGTQRYEPDRAAVFIFFRFQREIY